MKWTNELVKSELLKSIDLLNLNRMPTAEELKSIGRNDLHCKVSRTKRYSGWANELGLELKSSATNTGNEYEKRMADFLFKKGYSLKLTSNRHPYDLYVNNSVKIDVKVSSLHGTTWVFNLEKEIPTCDIYVLIALNDDKSTNCIYVIPSHHVQMKTIAMGIKSKYDVYKERYDLINDYSKFYNSIK
jgi:hypothetical protein